MVTEDDLQALLDQNPEDHQTRLVLADFLQDRDDPRADGYRALGVLVRKPCRLKEAKSDHPSDEWGWCSNGVISQEHYITWVQPCHKSAGLADDWVDTILGDIVPGSHPRYRYFATRRAAEDAAAVAWLQLPTERRTELLNGTKEPASAQGR